MDLMSLMIRIGADISGAQKGMEDVQQGMQDTAKKSDGFSGKVKNAFGAVKTAALGIGAGVVAAGAAITKLATSAAGATDRIDKMSQKIGISRQAFQEMDFIASQSGTSVEVLQVGMKTLRTSMTAAANGTKESVQQFKALGVSVKDSTGTLRNQEDVMFDTLAALQKIPNETERAAMATKLFGKAGIELVPLLNSGAGSIEEMKQKAHELGLVLDDDAVDAGVKLTDTIDQVKRAFDAVKTRIGVSVMPVVQNVLEIVLDNMPVIQKVLTAVFSVLGKVVGGAVKLIRVLTKPINALFKLIVNTLGPKVKELLERGQRFVQEKLGSISDAIQKRFGGIIDLFKQIPKSIKYAMQNGLDLPSFFANLLTGGRITQVINYSFEKFAQDLIQPALAKIFGGDAADTITSNLINAYNSVESVFSKIMETVAPIGEAINGLWESIIGLVHGTASIGQVGEAYLNVFKTAWQQIRSIDWASVGSAIWNGIKSGFNVVSGWLLKLVLGDNWTPESGWSDAGTKIWNTIQSGINAVNSWLLKLVLGDNWTPEAGWGEAGAKIWETIKNGFAVVNGWLLSLVLGDEYTPESGWSDVGKKLWEAIKAGFVATGDWIKSLVLGEEYTPDASWATVGGKIWSKIKRGFDAAGDWIKQTVLDEEYTPDATWADVGRKISGKTTEGLAGAVDWLKTLLDGWTAKLTDGSVDFASIGSIIWTDITGAFSDAVSWFVGLFGGKDDKDTDSVKGAIANIDWAGLGTSMLGLIVSAFSAVGETFKGFFVEAWNSINKLNWSGLGKNMWTAIKNAFKGVTSWFKELFKKPINAVIGFLNDMIGKVEDAVNTIVDGINSHLRITIPNVSWSWDFAHGNGGFSTDYANPFMDWNPNIGRVSLTRIKKLAEGGIVRNGERAIVGERGYPEYLRVVNGQAIVTPMKTGAAGGDSITFNIYQQPDQDPRTLADIVQRQLVQWEKQRRAAYT